MFCLWQREKVSWGLCVCRKIILSEISFVGMESACLWRRMENFPSRLRVLMIQTFQIRFTQATWGLNCVEKVQVDPIHKQVVHDFENEPWKLLNWYQRFCSSTLFVLFSFSTFVWVLSLITLWRFATVFSNFLMHNVDRKLFYISLSATRWGILTS